MNKKNLYQILGVEKSAQQHDIDEAYSKLHSKYQDAYDRGEQEASINLFNIKAAYDVLSNSVKRSLYNEKLDEAVIAPVAVVARFNFKAMLVLVFVTISIIVVLSLVYVFFFNGVERYYLGARFNSYISSIYSGEKDRGYEYLTPKGKSMVTLKAWSHAQSPSGQHLLVQEDIDRIRFGSRNQDIAVIVVERTLSSGKHDSYTQTWQKIGGVWYRAVDMDFSESYFERMTKIISDKEQEYSSFAIESGTLKWSISPTSGLVRPEVRVRILNTGAVPLKNLYMLVSLMTGSEIFSRTEQRVIGENDIPLGVGELSETYFFLSDKGFVLDANGDQWSEIAKIKFAQKATTAKIYYKRKYGDEWIELPVNWKAE